MWLLESSHRISHKNSAHGPATEGLAFEQALVWVSEGLKGGLALAPPSQEAALKLCKQLLSPGLSLKNGRAEGFKQQRSLVVILLHLLQAILAQAFGLESSHAADTQGASAPPETTNGVGHSSPSRSLPSADESEPTDRLSGGPESSGSGCEEGALQDDTGYQEMLESWRQSRLWLFLLGNTLLRALDLVGLPRFGDPGKVWPCHR